MLTPARLARALMSLNRVTIHGPWTRVVRFHHLLGPPPVLRERIRLNRYGGRRQAPWRSVYTKGEFFFYLFGI